MGAEGYDLFHGAFSLLVTDRLLNVWKGASDVIQHIRQFVVVLAGNKDN